MPRRVSIYLHSRVSHGISIWFGGYVRKRHSLNASLSVGESRPIAVQTDKNERLLHSFGVNAVDPYVLNWLGKLPAGEKEKMHVAI